jgi:hypothetical protein
MSASSFLEDAERLQRGFPRRVAIPRRAVRGALPPGCEVQLIFRTEGQLVAPDAPAVERLWCKVQSREGQGYRGVLTNAPRSSSSVRQGDAIVFGPEHIAAVSLPGAAPLTGLVGCDVSLLREGRWPLWLGRVPAEAEFDSGWRVFSSESGPGARVRPISSSTLLSSWPVLGSVLGSEQGGVFRWDEAALEFAAAAALPAALAAVASAGPGPFHELPLGPHMEAQITTLALERGPQVAERAAAASGRPLDSGWRFSMEGEAPAPVQAAEGGWKRETFARLYQLFPYLERVSGEDERGRWRWSDEAGDFVQWASKE